MLVGQCPRSPSVPAVSLLGAEPMTARSMALLALLRYRCAFARRRRSSVQRVQWHRHVGDVMVQCAADHQKTLASHVVQKSVPLRSPNIKPNKPFNATVNRRTPHHRLRAAR